MSKEQAKATIEKLVERFTEHFSAYHEADYNEAKTRQDFINPFFKALGWDVDNENGISEAYREVIYEDKVVVRGKAKAPDYGFRLMGQGKKRLFYVEAKKPSVSLKANKDAAYQLRRYGSSAQAPISILTNFEDFYVYDCSKVPNQNDSASVSRLKHISYVDYVKEFDFIYDTFSHEAVTKGRFDKFVQSDANKKGSQTLDKEFVQSLDTWRKYLATSIALNNKKINDDELNFCVQLIIDRLIFLRFCEDRAVEPYGQLQGAAGKANAYSNLFELFEQADDKYNSGLFDFEKDQLTAGLKIDNKVIKNIVDDLYFPQCRYEFSVMPVEVLGNAYEQFLGKVIRITPARGVKIEEKPEVRKAGGVFYTPQYIVEYIVGNTVGKLIEGKAPKEIDAIKIVDPACGSGSFLVGAFEYLLNYHNDWYHRHLSEKDKKKGDILTPDGKLTTHEKKRILINNIYGVDLDANAVEVSKLSLLLKCMEGETEASIKQQVSMFHERVLPDLDHNIKDGNSLIDVDFYDEQIDLGYEKKIKPFSWKKGFPEVFKQGGFDVVIGNPPYSLIGSDRKHEQDYFSSGKYELNAYKINTYILFLEKGLKLLKDEKNALGYIIPKSLVFNIFFDVTRRKLLKNYSMPKLIEIREKVFVDAEVGDSLLFFGEKSENPLQNTLQYFKVENVYPEFKIINSFETKQQVLINDYNGRFIPSGIKFKINTEPLSYYCDVFNGLNPGNVKDVLLSKEKKTSKHKKMVAGKDVQRYNLNWSGTWVNYDPTLKNKLTTAHIKSKKGMTAQNKVDFALRDKEIYLGEKIIVRKTSDHIVATYDNNEFYYDSLSYGVKSNKKTEVSLFFILGLLNSKLLSYLHECLADNKEKVFAKVLATNLSRLPLPKIDFYDKVQVNAYSSIVRNVETISNLHGELNKEKLPNNLEKIKQHIEHCEEKIDALVYELYKLTPEEIKIIEGGKNE